MRTNLVAIPTEWLTADYADITDNQCGVEIEGPRAERGKTNNGTRQSAASISVNPFNLHCYRANSSWLAKIFSDSPRNSFMGRRLSVMGIRTNFVLSNRHSLQFSCLLAYLVGQKNERFSPRKTRMKRKEGELKRE